MPSKTADDASRERARRRFESLPFARQLSLAQQFVSKEGTGFQRRFPNVVAVAAGLKRRRGESGEEEIHGCPCVVFLVDEKLPEERLRAEPAHRLPDFVHMRTTIDGRRVECAIPTDVQAQERLRHARAQSQVGVRCVPAGAKKPARGSICCVVSDTAGVRYVLAPIHVLSPFPDSDGRGVSSTPAQVFRLPMPGEGPDKKHFLRATSFGGSLAPSPASSFDVQLAKVLDEERLSEALQGIRLSPSQPFVHGPVALGNLLADGRRMEILVPANNPKRTDASQPPLQATLSILDVAREIHYVFDDDQQTPSTVKHAIMELQIAPGPATLAGDSGAPVVIPADDEGFVFVGMHIAGNSDWRTSFVIPAWRLLNALAYDAVGGKLPQGGLQFERH